MKIAIELFFLDMFVTNVYRKGIFLVKNWINYKEESIFIRSKHLYLKKLNPQLFDLIYLLSIAK